MLRFGFMTERGIFYPENKTFDVVSNVKETSNTVLVLDAVEKITEFQAVI